MKIATAFLALTALAGPAHAQKMGPAPDGEPAIVAQRIIQKQGFGDCTLVIAASRLGDGSIIARCRNDETFLVFSLSARDMAIRCSAVRELTGKGCL